RGRVRPDRGPAGPLPLRPAAHRRDRRRPGRPVRDGARGAEAEVPAGEPDLTRRRLRPRRAVTVLLPSPRWGEGLGVRGRDMDCIAPAHTHTTPRWGEGRGSGSGE